MKRALDDDETNGAADMHHSEQYQPFVPPHSLSAGSELDWANRITATAPLSFALRRSVSAGDGPRGGVRPVVAVGALDNYLGRSIYGSS